MGNAISNTWREYDRNVAEAHKKDALIAQDIVNFEGALTHDFVAAHEYLTNPENAVNKIIKPIGSASEWLVKNTTLLTYEQSKYLVRNAVSGHDGTWWERKCKGLEGHLNLLQQGVCAEEALLEVNNMEDLLLMVAPEARGLAGMKAAEAAALRAKVAGAMADASGKYESAYAKLLKEIDEAALKTAALKTGRSEFKVAQKLMRADAKVVRHGIKKARRQRVKGREEMHSASKAARKGRIQSAKAASKAALKIEKQEARVVQREAEMKAIRRSHKQILQQERLARGALHSSEAVLGASLALVPAAYFGEDSDSDSSSVLPELPDEPIHVPPQEDVPFHPDFEEGGWGGADDEEAGGGAGTVLFVAGGAVLLAVGVYVIYRSNK